MKRGEIKRRPSQIRQLRAGDPIPDGEPRRYTAGSGYIRLRWKVGPEQYVEVYEHRLVAGMPPSHMQVHHKDHDRKNNHPDNLEVLTREQHAQHHREHASRTSRRETEWGGLRSETLFKRRQAAIERRKEREELVRRAVELYRQGMSTTEVGEAIGRTAGNVSRMLRAAGVVPRPRNGDRRASEVTGRQRQRVHARARLRCERCDTNLVHANGEVHHRKRRSQGGTADLSNLLYLCAACHSWVTANPKLAEPEGTHVWSWQNPADVPVNTLGRARRLLSDGTERDVA